MYIILKELFPYRIKLYNHILNNQAEVFDIDFIFKISQPTQKVVVHFL